MDEDIKRAAALVGDSDALIITAGAGMGVDSGLPDFRGNEGFWKAYPAIAKLGLRFEQMAQPGWFEESPELAWAFYGHRLNLYRATTPHEGFSRLLKVGAQKSFGCFVFTSNVDGHFQKAGFAAGRIVECHGSIHHFQCAKSCGQDIWDASGEVVKINDATFQALPPLPVCPHCGAVARPNILMFNDANWNSDRTLAQELRLKNWLQEVKSAWGKAVILEIGAGTVVPTVRNWSRRMANHLSAPLIRINPREAGVSHGGLGLALNAAEGILRLCERL